MDVKLEKRAQALRSNTWMVGTTGRGHQLKQQKLYLESTLQNEAPSWFIQD